MSIPWRECPHQVVQQLSRVITIFLSPIAILVLIQKINATIRYLQAESTPYCTCSLEWVPATEHCHKRQECEQYLNLNKTVRNQENPNTHAASDANENTEIHEVQTVSSGPNRTSGSSADPVSAQDLKASLCSVHQLDLFCSCDMPVDKLVASPTAQGEGDDHPERTQVECHQPAKSSQRQNHLALTRKHRSDHSMSHDKDLKPRRDESPTERRRCTETRAIRHHHREGHAEGVKSSKSKSPELPRHFVKHLNNQGCCTESVHGTTSTRKTSPVETNLSCTEKRRSLCEHTHNVELFKPSQTVNSEYCKDLASEQTRKQHHHTLSLKERHTANSTVVMQHRQEQFTAQQLNNKQHHTCKLNCLQTATNSCPTERRQSSSSSIVHQGHHRCDEVRKSCGNRHPNEGSHTFIKSIDHKHDSGHPGVVHSCKKKGSKEQEELNTVQSVIVNCQGKSPKDFVSVNRNPRQQRSAPRERSPVNNQISSPELLKAFQCSSPRGHETQVTRDETHMPAEQDPEKPKCGKSTWVCCSCNKHIPHVQGQASGGHMLHPKKSPINESKEPSHLHMNDFATASEIHEPNRPPPRYPNYLKSKAGINVRRSKPGTDNSILDKKRITSAENHSSNPKCKSTQNSETERNHEVGMKDSNASDPNKGEVQSKKTSISRENPANPSLTGSENTTGTVENQQNQELDSMGTVKNQQNQELSESEEQNHTNQCVTCPLHADKRDNVDATQTDQSLGSDKHLSATYQAVPTPTSPENTPTSENTPAAENLHEEREFSGLPAGSEEDTKSAVTCVPSSKLISPTSANSVIEEAEEKIVTENSQCHKETKHTHGLDTDTSCNLPPDCKTLPASPRASGETAATLTNFHHTLLNWKNKLLAMEAGLHTPSAKSGHCPCVVCREDNLCWAPQDWHTRHSAQDYCESTAGSVKHTDFRHSLLDDVDLLLEKLEGVIHAAPEKMGRGPSRSLQNDVTPQKISTNRDHKGLSCQHDNSSEGHLVAQVGSCSQSDSGNQLQVKKTESDSKILQTSGTKSINTPQYMSLISLAEPFKNGQLKNKGSYLEAASALISKQVSETIKQTYSHQNLDYFSDSCLSNWHVEHQKVCDQLDAKHFVPTHSPPVSLPNELEETTNYYTDGQHTTHHKEHEAALEGQLYKLNKSKSLTTLHSPDLGFPPELNPLLLSRSVQHSMQIKEQQLISRSEQKGTKQNPAFCKFLLHYFKHIQGHLTAMQYQQAHLTSSNFNDDLSRQHPHTIVVCNTPEHHTTVCNTALPEVSGCCQTSENTIVCNTALPEVSGCCQTSENTTVCNTALPEVSECQTSENTTVCNTASPEVSGCCQTSENTTVCNTAWPEVSECQTSENTTVCNTALLEVSGYCQTSEKGNENLEKDTVSESQSKCSIPQHSACIPLIYSFEHIIDNLYRLRRDNIILSKHQESQIATERVIPQNHPARKDHLFTDSQIIENNNEVGYIHEIACADTGCKNCQSAVQNDRSLCDSSCAIKPKHKLIIADCDQQDPNTKLQHPTEQFLTPQNEPDVALDSKYIISEVNKDGINAQNTGQTLTNKTPEAEADEHSVSSNARTESTPSTSPSSLSVRQASSRDLTSPPLGQSAVLCTSSCVSVAGSDDEISIKDTGFQQAFHTIDQTLENLATLIERSSPNVA